MLKIPVPAETVAVAALPAPVAFGFGFFVCNLCPSLTCPTSRFFSIK
jgi:hypothetical protein